MDKMEKLAGTMNNIMVNSMAKWEAETWNEQRNVTFQMCRNVKTKSGREYFFKLELPEQTEKTPRGITKEDALSLGNATVYQVTTIRQRIK